jgi:hypothetical protein
LIFVAVGVLVGISCWLRANALLLTAFFAATVPLLIRNKLWWRNSLAVIFATLLIVLPLTLRNAIVFHRFIPLSLGAGQTLLEGIADYDDAGRFNVPKTDLGIMRQEAEAFQRPDYNIGLLHPDGIQRERWRLQRGFRIIGSHPVWFASVMMQRAGSMVKLERAWLVSTQPAITHSLDLTRLQPAAISTSRDLLANSGIRSTPVRVFLEGIENSELIIVGDDSSYGPQVSFSPFATVAGSDCVVEIPIRIENGRMRISVRNGDDRAQSSAIVEMLEGKAPQEQPLSSINLPFVSGRKPVRIDLDSEASTPRPLVHVGAIKLYELGPARFLWTFYPRLLIHGIQKLFITAIILPLAVLGIVTLVIRKSRDALIILCVVPLYYFCVQSVFHTEYRYVLAVNHFLFALSAVAVCWTGNLIAGKLRSGKQHKGELRDPVATPTRRGSDSAQAPVQSVR